MSPTTTVAVGQVWRDHRDDRLLEVTAITRVIAPMKGEPSITVRYANGRSNVYTAGHFGQAGRNGFTLVAAATTDRRIGGKPC